MKAHWQTYVMCLFCCHLDYFAVILEAKKILPTLYYGPRARKYVVVWQKGPVREVSCYLRAGRAAKVLARAISTVH